MSCERKVLTLPAGIGKFVFRNEVRVHQIGIWANATDIIDVNFNSIQTYQGVLGSVPAGITMSNSVTGFVWIPVDSNVIDIDFNTGTDTKAFAIVQYSEK